MPQLPNSSDPCLLIRAPRLSTGTQWQEWETLLSRNGTRDIYSLGAAVPASCTDGTLLS